MSSTLWEAYNHSGVIVAKLDKQTSLLSYSDKQFLQLIRMYQHRPIYNFQLGGGRDSEVMVGMGPVGTAHNLPGGVGLLACYFLLKRGGGGGGGGGIFPPRLFLCNKDVDAWTLRHAPECFCTA